MLELGQRAHLARTWRGSAANDKERRAASQTSCRAKCMAIAMPSRECAWIPGVVLGMVRTGAESRTETGFEVGSFKLAPSARVGTYRNCGKSGPASITERWLTTGSPTVGVRQ